MKYVTTHQYEPLRTPSRWGAEEKRLIVQLTEILDDIYRRYGRLSLKDVNAPFKEVLATLRTDVDANADGLVDTNEELTHKLSPEDVANNLTTTAAGKVLDARQGKALNEAKLDKTDVANNLTTTAAGKALDARQGKALNEAKLDKTDVVASLEETTPGKALDATQAAALLLAAWPVGSVYMSVSDVSPGFGGTWEPMTSTIAGVYLWERTE